jgi:hypothetical protein
VGESGLIDLLDDEESVDAAIGVALSVAVNTVSLLASEWNVDPNRAWDMLSKAMREAAAEG